MNKERNNWYINFYKNFYLKYFYKRQMKVRRNKKETNFICHVLQLPKGSKILDLACGLGRHAIELSERGFKVIGLDFNDSFLVLAKKEARKRKVPLKLVKSDMRYLPFRGKFDGVICMYTTFGYFINEKENFKVLKAVSRSLKKDGLFLLDLPNKYWTLTKVPTKIEKNIRGQRIVEERSFDISSKILKNKITFLSLGNKTKNAITFLHLYDDKEIRRKLSKVKLKIIKIFGNYNIKASFNRRNSPRMIILAKKN